MPSVSLIHIRIYPGAIPIQLEMQIPSQLLFCCDYQSAVVCTNEIIGPSNPAVPTAGTTSNSFTIGECNDFTGNLRRVSNFNFHSHMIRVTIIIIFILNKKGMAVCGSKNFSNKRVNFSQVTHQYYQAIPTSLP